MSIGNNIKLFGDYNPQTREISASPPETKTTNGNKSVQNETDNKIHTTTTNKHFLANKTSFSSSKKTLKQKKITTNGVLLAKNDRYNAKAIARSLVQQYGADPELLKEAVNYLQNNDIRFINQTDSEFSYNEDLASEIDNELDSQPPNNTSKVGPTKLGTKKIVTENKRNAAVQALAKKIAPRMAGLAERKPVSHKTTQNSTMTQSMGHVEKDAGGVYEVKEGRTASAEEQKKTNVQEVANHGKITHQTSNEKSEVIMTRSSRTDTPDKVNDKSIAHIVAAMESDNRSAGGLQPSGQHDDQGQPIYTFQRSDVTLMDRSPVKSAATSVPAKIKGFFKGKRQAVENERTFISHKKSAIKTLWKLETDGVKKDASGRIYKERTIKTTEGQFQVREYKPLLINHVFSGQAKSNVKTLFINNVRTARVKNKKSYKQLGDLLASNYPAFASIKLQGFSKNSTRKNIRILKQILNKPNNALSPKQKMALEGLLIGLSGKDSNGRDYDTSEGSALQFMYTCILSDEAGIGLSTECKSGNDRTATSMGIRCAMKDWEEKYSTPYDPSKFGENPNNDKEFAELFCNYISTFGRSNVLASRGASEVDGNESKPILKVASSPAFKAIANAGGYPGTERLEKVVVLK